MKSSYKSLSQVITANSIILIIGILVTFLLPSILEPAEYGYWSLYVLYVSYSGFIIFGFCDGFYLKYGGTNYKDINKKLFSSLHLILIIYLFIALFLWTIAVQFLLHDSPRYLVLLFIGIGGILTALDSFYILLNQATARFSIYSKGHVIEKITILLVVIITLLLPNPNEIYIIIASIMGKIFTTIYFIYYSRDIVFKKTKITTDTLKNVKENINIGLVLTLSNIGIMLMTGFGRFIVDKKMGISELGYYSLMFSVAALFTQLISAISTVFFPLFRKTDSSITKSVLIKLDKVIIYFSVIVLIAYYPTRLILEFLLPKYNPAMNSLLYLFPLVILQARISIVYSTLYKVFRMEKQFLISIFLSLVFCIIITLTFFNFLPEKETVALSTYLSFIFWNCLIIYIYNKTMKTEISIISMDIILSLLYIATNIIFKFSLISFFTSLGILVIYLFFNHRNSVHLIREIKDLVE